MISTTEDPHHQQQQQYQHAHLSEPLSDPLLLPGTAPRPRRDTFSPQQDNLYPFLRTPPDRHTTDTVTAAHTTIPTISSTIHTSAGATAGSNATTGTSSAVLKASTSMVDRNKSHLSSALFKESSSSQKNILPSPIHPPPRNTLSLTSSTHPYTHTKVSIPSKRWLPNHSGYNQPLIKELQYVLKQRNVSTPTATSPTYITPTDGTSPTNTTTNTIYNSTTNTTSRSNIEEYEHNDYVYTNRAAVLNHLSVGNPYYRNLRKRLHTHALTVPTATTGTTTVAAASGTGTTTVSAATTAAGGELVSNSRDYLTNFSYTIHSPKQQQQQVPGLHAQHDYIVLSNHNTTTTTLPLQQYEGIDLVESDSEDKYKTAPNSV